jgi:hypothetical protein
MANPFTRRSRGLSDRTLSIVYTFAHSGVVGAVSADKNYGVTKTTYGANVTMTRAAFTASLAAALRARFGTGLPVENVVYSMGGTTAAIGAQATSGERISFDLIDNGRAYSDSGSPVTAQNGIQEQVTRAFASAAPAWASGNTNITTVVSLLRAGTPAGTPASTPSAGDAVAAARELKALVDSNASVRSGARSEAVRALQRRMGMSTGAADGQFGNTTRGVMEGLISGAASGTGVPGGDKGTGTAPSDAVVAARALKTLVTTNSRIREGAFSADVQALQRRMGMVGTGPTGADGRYGDRSQQLMESLISGAASGGGGGGGGGTSIQIQLPPAPPAPTEDQMAAARDLVAFVTSSAPGTLVSAAGRAVFSQRVSDLQARMGGGIAVDGLYGSESRRRIENLIGGTAPMARGPQGAAVAAETPADRTAQEQRATTEAGLLGGLVGGGGSSKMSTATIAAIGVGVIVVSVAFAYATGALGGSAGAVVAAPSRSRSYRSRATKRSGR